MLFFQHLYCPLKPPSCICEQLEIEELYEQYQQHRWVYDSMGLAPPSTAAGDWRVDAARSEATAGAAGAAGTAGTACPVTVADVREHMIKVG